MSSYIPQLHLITDNRRSEELRGGAFSIHPLFTNALTLFLSSFSSTKKLVIIFRSLNIKFCCFYFVWTLRSIQSVANYLRKIDMLRVG